MKKFLSLTLVAVFVILASMLTGCSDDEIKDTTISIGDASALAGDTVKLPFSISGNKGLWGGQVIINYDASVFEYVTCTNGDLFDRCDDNDIDGQLCLVVSQSDAKNISKDGLIATLNFRIKDTADDGKYDISFDKETNFSNIEGELKEVLFENGTVEVK